MRLARRVGIGVLALAISAHVFAQADASGLDKFVGTWKEDRSKRVAVPVMRDPLRFQVDRNGRIEELRGPAEHTSVHPVVFVGPMDVLLGGASIIWKQIDSNTFEQVTSDERGVVRTRKLTIAPGGNILNEHVSERTNDGGFITTRTVYSRSSAGRGLIGRWQSISVETPLADITIEKLGSNTLRFSTRYSPAYALTVDGVPRQVHGAATPPLEGATKSARLLPDGALEQREFRKGSESLRSVMAVSADGKTITNTVTNPAAGAAAQPSIFVLVRQ